MFVYNTTHRSRDVRRHRAQRLSLVRLDGLGRVVALDLEVGVHCDEDVGDVRLQGESAAEQVKNATSSE